MEIINKLGYTYEKPSYPESFKLITYPGVNPGKYMISNHGRVWNLNMKIIMKTFFDNDGHERICLSTNIKHPTKRGNKQKKYFIHRLMLWEFVGPPPDEIHNIGNHLNGIPCCNFINNLEWTSVLGNTNHAKQIGLMNNSGLNSASRKYDEKIIRRICSLYEQGYSVMEVYEIMTGLSRKQYKTEQTGLYNLLCKLKQRITFLDVVCDYDYEPNKSSHELSDEQKKIREMIMDNKNNYEILYAFGYRNPSDDRTFYNRIITERLKCKALFNDYRKHSS